LRFAGGPAALQRGGQVRAPPLVGPSSRSAQTCEEQHIRTARPHDRPTRPQQRYALPRLSPTALERFRTCPLAFKIVNLDGRTTAPRRSAAMVQGNAVHHALERFFGLPAEDRRPELLERALRSVWNQHRDERAFTSREAEGDCGREALRMLARFAERHDLAVVPLARERWLSHTFSDGIELYGKIDRIDDTPSGLQVVDYKTSRHPIDAEDLPRDLAAQIYALLAATCFRRPVARVRFIYLALDHEVRWEPEAEDLDATGFAVADLAQRIGTAQAHGEWEARPGDQCRWCPAAATCPERDTVSLDELTPDADLAF
jgi:putative RecB family exonuclease